MEHTGGKRAASFLCAALVAFSALAGCLAPAGTSGNPSEEGPEAAEPFSFRADHSFLEADAATTFLVPSGSTADVSLWFEGIVSGGEPASILLRDPSGAVFLQTSTPSNFVGGAIGGRSYAVERVDVALPPGEWAVEFSGRGTMTGHADVRSS